MPNCFNKELKLNRRLFAITKIHLDFGGGPLLMTGYVYTILALLILTHNLREQNNLFLFIYLFCRYLKWLAVTKSFFLKSTDLHHFVFIINHLYYFPAPLYSDAFISSSPRRSLSVQNNCPDNLETTISLPHKGLPTCKGKEKRICEHHQEHKSRHTLFSWEASYKSPLGGICKISLYLQ